MMHFDPTTAPSLNDPKAYEKALARLSQCPTGDGALKVFFAEPTLAEHLQSLAHLAKQTKHLPLPSDLEPLRELLSQLGMIHENSSGAVKLESRLKVPILQRTQSPDSLGMRKNPTLSIDDSGERPEDAITLPPGFEKNNLLLWIRGDIAKVVVFYAAKPGQISVYDGLDPKPDKPGQSKGLSTAYVSIDDPQAPNRLVPVKIDEILAQYPHAVGLQEALEYIALGENPREEVQIEGEEPAAVVVDVIEEDKTGLVDEKPSEMQEGAPQNVDEPLSQELAAPTIDNFLTLEGPGGQYFTDIFEDGVAPTPAAPMHSPVESTQSNSTARQFSFGIWHDALFDPSWRQEEMITNLVPILGACNEKAPIGIRPYELTPALGDFLLHVKEERFQWIVFLKRTDDGKVAVFDAIDIRREPFTIDAELFDKKDHQVPCLLTAEEASAFNRRATELNRFSKSVTSKIVAEKLGAFNEKENKLRLQQEAEALALEAERDKDIIETPPEVPLNTDPVEETPVETGTPEVDSGVQQTTQQSEIKETKEPKEDTPIIVATSGRRTRDPVTPLLEKAAIPKWLQTRLKPKKMEEPGKDASDLEKRRYAMVTEYLKVAGRDSLTASDIKKLFQAGKISFSIPLIYRSFEGGMPDLQRAAGRVPNESKWEHWSTQNMIDYGKWLKEIIGRTPSIADFEEARTVARLTNAPTKKTILRAWNEKWSDYVTAIESQNNKTSKS